MVRARAFLVLALTAGWLVGMCGCEATRRQTAATGQSLRDLVLPKRHAYQIPEEDYDVIPKLGKDDEAELSLAYAKWMEDIRNLTEARQHYSEVVERQPECIDALLGLARVDQLSGRTREAEQEFHRALRIDPGSAVALHGLGQFYAVQRRWPDAVDTFHRAMLAAPTDSGYRFDLAVAMVHADDIDGALPHFIRTVGDAEAHYNVGLILREEGRLAEAEQQMLLAVTKKPDLVIAQQMLDDIRRERGEDYDQGTQLASDLQIMPLGVRTAEHLSGAAPAR